jgi:hypothetical protein
MQHPYASHASELLFKAVMEFALKAILKGPWFDAMAIFRLCVSMMRKPVANSCGG